ncbi:MAG: beta-ketoacyl-[acyl-carrier-protein] synthase family protein [Oscillospiraceae bacterium]|nr:beta-ketoacyl-[acyl-carrier-protein] synthase family protein [Oscillospiraceae bacterium]
MEKVLVTGMGAVCSIGNSVDEYWNNLIDGKCGIKTISRISLDNHDSTLAAEVDDEFETLAKKYWSKRQLGSVTASVRVHLAASGEAIDDSGIDFSLIDTDRVAVIMGNPEHGYVDSETDKAKNIIIKKMISSSAALISSKYGLHGASFGLGCACSSSGYAMALAAHLIETGFYDIVITGGLSGFVAHDTISGFNQILAMSANPDPETACRPFTKNRDGFIMGEGAGTVILESETSAKRRNAKVYARLSGYAFYSEASDMTAPLPEGEGMRKVMEKALKQGNISPDAIDYINAHGTSTGLNDKYETMAIKNLFGERAYSIPVSSTKSSIGHTLGAGSVLESIASIKALNEGIIPPTIHYDEADPDLDLDYVPNKARKAELKTVLTNSFGFGGQNSTLIFEKY